MLENVFGYIGGILSSGAMLPQWIRMIRTRSTQDISWAMLGMSLSGQVLWIVHGAIQEDPVIILFCCITLILNTGVMATKCIHQNCLHPWFIASKGAYLPFRPVAPESIPAASAQPISMPISTNPPV